MSQTMVPPTELAILEQVVSPEQPGMPPEWAQAILRLLHGVDFAGMDLVEVAPAYDVSEITALAGATMVWEYLSLLGSRIAPAP